MVSKTTRRPAPVSPSYGPLQLNETSTNSSTFNQYINAIPTVFQGVCGLVTQDSGLARMDENSDGLDRTAHSRKRRSGRTIEDDLVLPRALLRTCERQSPVHRPERSRPR